MQWSRVRTIPPATGRINLPGPLLALLLAALPAAAAEEGIGGDLAVAERDTAIAANELAAAARAPGDVGMAHLRIERALASIDPGARPALARASETLAAAAALDPGAEPAARLDLAAALDRLDQVSALGTLALAESDPARVAGLVAEMAEITAWARRGALGQGGLDQAQEALAR